MTSSLLGGIQTPSLPLVIMSSFRYPHPSLYTRKWQEKLIRDKKACTVADEYRFSSDVPSILCLGLRSPLKWNSNSKFQKMVACLKLQITPKEVIWTLLSVTWRFLHQRRSVGPPCQWRDVFCTKLGPHVCDITFFAPKEFRWASV